MRLDRAIAVHLFHPRAQRHAADGSAGVPILMYHGIEPPTRKGHPYYETSTSPATFALHMNFLAENGYTAIDLEEALGLIARGPSPRKCVAITFDDGYRNFYTSAFPILMDHSFRATLFLVSGLIGDTPRRRDGHEYLTWNEVRTLRANGIQIGSHTVNHPTLHHENDSTLEYEIGHSKQTIEDQVGECVRTFSYPYAFPENRRKFTFRVRELLHTYGYVCGVSTIIGRATPQHDWFFLPRIPMNSHDDLRLFRAKLEGGYDWLGGCQYLSKCLRDSLRLGNSARTVDGIS